MTDAALLITLAVVIIALALIEKAPTIIAGLADWRLAGRAEGIRTGWTTEELALALVAGIRRTDPDIALELAERLATDVVHDLDSGVLTVGAPDSPRLPE